MATLKNLVDETTNIKNELKTCHTNLVNNLSAKGVSVSSGDKLGDLVDKVIDIYSPRAIAGDSNKIWNYSSTSTSTSSYSYKTVTTFDGFLIKGSYRVKFLLSSLVSANRGVCKIEHKRGSNVINEKIVYASYNNDQYISFVLDFEDIEKGDNIVFYHKLENNSGGTSHLTGFGIYCDLI